MKFKKKHFFNTIYKKNLKFMKFKKKKKECSLLNSNFK